MTLAGEKTAYRNSHKLAKHQKGVSFYVGPYPDVSQLSLDEALKSITNWIDDIKRQAMSLEMYDVEIVETTDPWDDRWYRDWSAIGTVNKTPEEIAKDEAKAARRAAAAEKRAANMLAQEEALLTKLVRKHPETAKALVDYGKTS